METVKTAKRESGNLLAWWFSWYFLETPRALLRIAGNFLRFGLNYFSVPLLVRTLFTPWRQYLWKYPRGFDLREYSQVFFSNLISRFLGALARVFLMVLAVVTEIFLLVAGFLIFFLWLFGLPIALALIFFGFKWILGI